jgi:hypothetical protein
MSFSNIFTRKRELTTSICSLILLALSEIR